MSKIWILHNSKHGNSEKVSQDIAEKLKDKYEISVGSIKKITPEDVARDNPNGVIIGARILAGIADRKLRKFLLKIGALMENNIPKLAIFYTHATSWAEENTKFMDKTLGKTTCIDEVCPEYLHVKVAKIKGPIESGQDAKVDDFIGKIIAFM